MPKALDLRIQGFFFAYSIVVLHNTEMSSTKPTVEAYAELQQAYDFYNEALFSGILPPCLITFQRQKKTFGYFSRNRFGRLDGRTTDEIALNPGYFAVVPMVEVLQTLVHEMVHLWQEHFGKPSRACYHNKEWADKMEVLGLMPSSTGLPGGKRVGQSIADYAITGGLFEAATNELLEGGFAISWLDRFPEQPPARFLSQFHPTAGVKAGAMAPESDVGVDDPDQAGGNEAAWRSPSITQLGIVEAVKTGNRSNRSKYTCPECALNVWGKPGLRIMCVDHDKLLIEGMEDLH